MTGHSPLLKHVYALWTFCPDIGLNDRDNSKNGIERFLEKNPETCFGKNNTGSENDLFLTGLPYTTVRQSCFYRFLPNGVSEQKTENTIKKQKHGQTPSCNGNRFPLQTIVAFSQNRLQNIEQKQSLHREGENGTQANISVNIPEEPGIIPPSASPYHPHQSPRDIFQHSGDDSRKYKNHPRFPLKTL